MNILIVEDDATIAATTAQALVDAGNEAMVASTLDEAREKAGSGAWDAIVLDLMLPDGDGADLLHELRERGDTVPVLVLSARQSVEDRVRHLESGSDDYLTKPFAISELLARLAALRRRSAGRPMSLTHSGLMLDLVHRKAYRDGCEMDLKGREFALLLLLMENAGTVVTRNMIVKRVWGYDFMPGSNIIDVQICQLREKTERNGAPRVIHTMRGVGYVFGLADAVA
ncbi:response regulator transcription factor [Nitratidesulfovibrio vulgaris]|jgi:two-component system OmpR family response regulator|uniref:DNA-binding response regulator n=2 Tax=Nitratidesulfovibrio vulgaris TaxID=881 RepID=Q728L5_NITV2|nr:response regulator transcription factor [Nitratidesulfovibrio vulgaris]GEB81521.1 DNA-binding response regulator [Desulfovibrio desulfuricans]HBW15316.1 DNA-binding response regulator [Desulfovibrio sp.]AAS97060.1 DNA-binding response regulator [Nitratidesulfovibrio vulgaris str. Hildenborough]ADP87534.1 two component transcriptional regulator, winged helix family [Nitratidesulfovibrio vulgaris RCH1]WCB47444.1 response regulator transcription factor [Nitratidesulfovibrio vulgaris]